MGRYQTTYRVHFCTFCCATVRYSTVQYNTACTTVMPREPGYPVNQESGIHRSRDQVPAVGESGELAAVKSIIIPTPKCFPYVQDCCSILSSSYCIIIFIIDCCVYSRSDCSFAFLFASSLSFSLSPSLHPALLSLSSYFPRPADRQFLAAAARRSLSSRSCWSSAVLRPPEFCFSLRLDAVLYLLYQSIRLPDFPCLLCNPVSLEGRRCINYLSFNRAARPLYNKFVRPTPGTAVEPPPHRHTNLSPHSMLSTVLPWRLSDREQP